MTPEQLKLRGEQAKRLVEDKLLIEALDSIEKEIIEKWEACPARDKEGREELWVYYKTSKKFRSTLQGTIESGKVAQLQEKSLKDQALSLVRRK